MINILAIICSIDSRLETQNMNYLSKLKDKIYFNESMTEITFNGQKFLVPLVVSIMIEISTTKVDILTNGQLIQTFATIEDDNLLKTLGIGGIFTPRTFIEIKNIQKLLINSKQHSINVLIFPENEQQINLTQILNDLFTELNHQYNEYNRSISKKSK